MHVCWMNRNDDVCRCPMQGHVYSLVGTSLEINMEGASLARDEGPALTLA